MRKDENMYKFLLLSMASKSAIFACEAVDQTIPPPRFTPSKLAEIWMFLFRFSCYYFLTNPYIRKSFFFNSLSSILQIIFVWCNDFLVYAPQLSFWDYFFFILSYSQHRDGKKYPPKLQFVSPFHFGMSLSLFHLDIIYTPISFLVHILRPLYIPISIFQICVQRLFFLSSIFNVVFFPSF